LRIPRKAGSHPRRRTGPRGKECRRLGTALVYPTLIAAMSDAVAPVARAPVVGVYRFRRDSGYALGAIIAGATADALGYGGAIAIVAGLTAASGIWVLYDMPTDRRETTPAATAVTSGLTRL
jgi:predicted MFS family arabinose efflux permease